ncbi:tektin family domain-containing protein [Phthorimaea operculella]|nr:tektin family domain-containing protein [Phthorimaea operculella]
MAASLPPPPDQSRYECPLICPSTAYKEVPRTYKQAGSERHDINPSAMPYRPGQIQPPQPTQYPAGAPPPYLPQAEDSTSGDYLRMGPIDPWAPGHVDWSPSAGSTGVRPVVDKFSITRYSTGQWRKHNQFMLNAHVTKKGEMLNNECRKDMAKALKDLEDKSNHTNSMLDKRIKDLSYWKKNVEKAQKGMSDELEALEVDRARLKTASQILMIPEAIAKECLELRTHRYEPDQVRDNAEQELIREVALVGEIRRVFDATLMKVNEQILEDRFAKAAIELDWGDKMVSLREDKLNRAMNYDSSHILHHPGVDRWTENSTSLEYWLHYCAENIKNCKEVMQRSANLRNDLMTAIVKGGQDMKTQSDRTNMALAETVAATEALCEKLEEGLRDNLQKIADVENLLDYLRESNRKLEQKGKLCMTRLHSRNYDRPNVENCRDEAQYALMEEAKLTKETRDLLKDKVRQADLIRAELMKFRGDLEKDIACKRKSLNIDRDRMQRIRAHMPSAETFANVVGKQ